MSRTGLFPGSFDPPTLGHIDIIKRAASVFDRVFVAVLDNKNKSNMFSVESRLRMLRESTKDISNVTVESFDGLLVDYAEKIEASAVVRGVRSAGDFEYEYEMYKINSSLSDRFEAVFIPAKSSFDFISSSTVRELISFGGDFSKMVPPEAAEIIYEELRKR